MSLKTVQREFQAALTTGNKVDSAEADKIIKSTQDMSFDPATRTMVPLSKSEKKEIGRILDRHADKLDPEAYAKLAAFIGRDTPPVTPPTTGRTELRSDNQVWTTTYWPMAGSMGDADGSPAYNLWAKDGPLDKFDALLKKRGEDTGALKHERAPALNFLVGKEAGHYIPDSNLSEADAERTTGIDFNGNGKIDANVKWDFLDENGQFGQDGKKTGTMNVGWWGSCDKVALAGIMFKEPKKSVTVDGVTFTPQDIKGLLTVIADDQAGTTDFKGSRYDGAPDVVYKTNGDTVVGTIENMENDDFRTGSFYRRSGDFVVRTGMDKDVQVRKPDGEVVTVKKADIKGVAREDKEDVEASVFHETIKSWLGEKRSMAMDHDRGDHVWNDNYDGANIEETTKVPAGVNKNELNGFNGPYSGGDLTFVSTEMLKGDDVSKSYQYWIEEKNGKVVNSGWLGDNPDFLWRPANTPSFTGYNSRNPFVKPELVKEIYEKSIAE